jgi:hypothetical protein
MKLVVNGNDFFINGMNWDYFPIGTNYSYSLWKQPDDIIRAALDAEMSYVEKHGRQCRAPVHRGASPVDTVHL